MKPSSQLFSNQNYNDNNWNTRPFDSTQSTNVYSFIEKHKEKRLKEGKKFRTKNEKEWKEKEKKM